MRSAFGCLSHEEESLAKLWDPVVDRAQDTSFNPVSDSRELARMSFDISRGRK
jgi:hypothetical protein